MEAFKDEIRSQVKNTHFENNLFSDPNVNYDKLESIIMNAEKKCFPIREVKFNKYRHKISPWMTNEILDELKFRDKLYVKWENVLKHPQIMPNMREVIKVFALFCKRI